MPDVMTREQAVSLIDGARERAQMVSLDMGQLATTSEEMNRSQQAFHRALSPAGADIDDDTLVATAELAGANSIVSEQSTRAAREADEVVAHLGAALRSLVRHAPLSEAVQAHKGAAKLGFYRPS